ncbi:MAG: FixH family protein [Gammaproteobacteria bacterium]|nr:FixH family protein [Gammaproteobacteria bacterium]
MHKHDSIPPWYKQFWPWFILGILIFAVIIGLGLLFIALTNQDAMVRDNYYREGRAINMHLGRDQMARELSLRAEFTIDELTGDISLQLEGGLDPMPQRLQLDLIAPTLAHLDRSSLLTRISGNQYRGQLDEGVAGRLYIDLHDPDRPGDDGWRLAGEKQISLGEQYELVAR